MYETYKLSFNLNFFKTVLHCSNLLSLHITLQYEILVDFLKHKFSSNSYKYADTFRAFLIKINTPHKE